METGQEKTLIFVMSPIRNHAILKVHPTQVVAVIGSLQMFKECQTLGKRIRLTHAGFGTTETVLTAIYADIPILKYVIFKIENADMEVAADIFTLKVFSKKMLF